MPLSTSAMSILSAAFDLNSNEADRKNDRWSGYAFPGRADGSGKGMTRGAIAHAVGRIRAASRKANPKRPLSNITPHDLRRTGATFITGERIGLPRFNVSRVLNQMTDTGGAAAVTRIYDRNEYLADKRKALDAWALLLLEMVEGQERVSNVTPLRAS